MMALLMSLVRFGILPDLPNHRPQLETTLSELLAEKIRIGSLTGRLDGLNPVLTAGDVCLLDAHDAPSLCLARIDLDLDTLGTVLSGQPAIRQLHIAGIELTLIRLSDGTFGISGLHSTGTGTTPAWLLATRSIELIDARIHWQDQTRGTPPIFLGTTTVRLNHNADRHRLGFDVSLPENLGHHLGGQVDITGNVMEPATLIGKIHLDIDRLKLATLGSLLPEQTIGVTAGELSGTFSGDWAGHDLKRFAGDMAVNDAVLTRHSVSGDDRSLSFSRLNGHFVATHEGDDWQFSLDRFQPGLGTLWPETRAAVRVTLTAENRLKKLHLSTDYLDLKEIARVLETVAPEESALNTTLPALKPQGTVHQLRLYVEPEAVPGQQWGGQVKIRNLAVEAWQQIPGLQNAAVELRGNDLSGQLALTIDHGSIDLPSLGFKAKPNFDRFAAQIEWLQTADNWNIGVKPLRFERGHFKGEADLTLALPKQQDISPWINLKATVHDIDTITAKNLMPHGVIPHTSNWFDKAMSDGLIRRADLILQGPLRRFPFKQDEGVFEALLDVEDVDMMFHPQWLPLTGTSARLRFRGPGLEIESKQGRIGKAELVDVKAHIDDLNDKPWLELDGVATASVADAFELLMHSPIHRIPEQISQLISVSGNTRVALKLKVPLDHRLGETEVNGAAEFLGAGLLFRDLGLKVEQVEGPLAFTRDQLSADGIKAKFLSHPIGVKVSQHDKHIFIGVDGYADVPALAYLFGKRSGGTSDPARNPPAQPFWSRVKGGADYQLQLRIPESLNAQSDDFQLTVNSNLQGLAFDLPTPLGKSDKTQTPLSVEVTLRQGSDAPVRVSLGHQIRALLTFSEPLHGFVWKGGQIAAGRSLPETGKTAGLSLYARLDDMDLAAWWAAWGLLRDKPDRVSDTFAVADSDKTTVRKPKVPVRANNPTAKPPPSAADHSNGVGLNGLELDVGQLHWHQQALGDLHLSLRQDSGSFTGEVEGRLARGHWQASPQRIRMELEHLRWPKLTSERQASTASGTPASDESATTQCTPPVSTATADSIQARNVVTCESTEPTALEPDSLPALNLTVRHLHLQNAELGELTVSSEKHPGGIRLENLKLSAPGRELVMTGDWKRSAASANVTGGVAHQTAIKGHLSLDDLGETLSDLGWPGEVRETPTRLDFAMSWPGAPQQFSVGHLSGAVDVNLGKGGLPRIDPGLGRVLGLLNLDTIWRRLSFDFSDLFGEGLAYDGVTGALLLDHGQGLTDGLLIDAVPAKIVVSGRAGLLKRDLDQIITVIPHTTASLPIAGVLAGGPAVGAAVFVAQRLIGERVDSITASHYTLKGGWQEPRIEKMAGASSLEWLDKAWSGIKNLSGLGSSKQQQ